MHPETTAVTVGGGTASPQRRWAASISAVLGPLIEIPAALLVLVEMIVLLAGVIVVTLEDETGSEPIKWAHFASHHLAGSIPTPASNFRRILAYAQMVQGAAGRSTNESEDQRGTMLVPS